MRKFIDDDAEHLKVLFELGIVDDLEDWELFCKQREVFYEYDNEIDVDTWFKYVRQGNGQQR